MEKALRMLKGSPVVLASKSPRRKEILEAAGFEFDIISKGVDEDPLKGEKPAQTCTRLASAKAERVLDAVIKSSEAVVIGADTLVVCDQDVLGKPGSSAEAFNMLKSLRGRTHEVVTGVAVFHGGEALLNFFETSKVTFAKFPESEAYEYIETGKPMDKAGAYGIQDDFGMKYIEKIDGDYLNVVGFPLSRLLAELEEKA